MFDWLGEFITGLYWLVGILFATVMLLLGFVIYLLVTR